MHKRQQHFVHIKRTQPNSQHIHMASSQGNHKKLHFVLVPLMCPGHIIPIVDIAKLIAERMIKVTIVSTPRNAERFLSILDRPINSGLPINVLVVKIDSLAMGLPEGCESADELPSMDLGPKFIAAVTQVQGPVEQFLREAEPGPSCIVSDRNLVWTAETARRFRVPRILFDGTSCFSVVCNDRLYDSKVYEGISETAPFLVPGLPDRVELTREQLPGLFNPGSNRELDGMRRRMREAEEGAYGLIVNSFEELEPGYVDGCRKLRGKVWCVGPVSVIHKDRNDRNRRGNHRTGSIIETQISNWLDSRKNGSVVYACLGSLNRLTPPQLVELGLGLESTNRPFVWVVRGRYRGPEFEDWLIRDGFEARVRERGIVIRGWAPQVMILSHPAVGGFLTHCGWNSTTEGVCTAVPMVAWPLFGEQFYNEKLLVEVLGIGVKISGADAVMQFGEEEVVGVTVKRESVREAVEEVMGGGDRGEERRWKVKRLAEMAGKAVEECGSSYSNLTALIQDLSQLVDFSA